MANSALYLKVVGQGRNCDFLYSTDGNDWKTVVADADAINLSTQYAGGFIGTLIGPYATTNFKL
jgi:xylan 1,4-beta-xylosidase